MVWIGLKWSKIIIFRWPWPCILYISIYYQCIMGAFLTCFELQTTRQWKKWYNYIYGMILAPNVSKNEDFMHFDLNKWPWPLTLRWILSFKQSAKQNNLPVFSNKAYFCLISVIGSLKFDKIGSSITVTLTFDLWPCTYKLSKIWKHVTIKHILLPYCSKLYHFIEDWIWLYFPYFHFVE